MIKKLIRYVSGYWTQTLAAPVMTVCEVGMEVYIPYLMGKIIDQGIANGDRGYVLRIGAWMVCCAVFSLLFGVLGSRFTSAATSGFAFNLRGALFRKIQDFSFANVDRFSTSSLITRLTTDVGQVEMAMRMTIRMMLRSTVMMVSATVMALSINAKLSLVFLFALPVLGIALAIITVKAHKHFTAMMARFDHLNAVIEENLTGIRVVKAFVRRDEENRKMREAAGSIKDTQLKAEHVVIFNNPVMNAVIYATTILLFWLGSKQLIGGTLLTGEFLTLINYVRQILFSLMSLSMVFVMLVMSVASAERIVEVLDEGPDINDADADRSAVVENGAVAFQNVNFSYKKGSDNYVLQDINLDIRSGETIGIIGGTGSAKSTLVQLIPRLYDASSGSIRIGGRDIRDYPVHTLRNACAMVLQKNLLFSGTIKENLRWGNPDATDEEMAAACKAAQAHDFIMGFPDGYDTWLEQGGVNLSGGQKQRLCIARALLKRPKILILDDSTSAVDTATDAAIRAALKEQIADTTTFIIAQRISSVSDADRVIVLDNGRVDGFGTPEELMKTNTIYREVYESQQKGAQENG